MVAGILLLETKLYIPKWRPGLVSRPRLIERMHQGSDRKLTLISAPAGFGKTTLLTEWVAAALAKPTVWVSLDQGDNDPAFFWAYVITALQKVQFKLDQKAGQRLGQRLGQRALSLLQSPQPSPIESVLTTLINEINATENDFSLILDDYHVVENQAIHGAIAFLLDHLPPQMHLIIASRSDPPLSLAGLRGRGELTELRVADLRFTPDEAAAFLNEVMGLEISAADVATLEKQTEGWIAGLQLAALSMQGREDIPGFVAAFSGDDRYILDYLIEEVLQRQPEPVRSFLLQTAILERLSGPLCDAVTTPPNQSGAVTDQNNGKKMLETLERGNLFVVPLDDKRQWYRYHHLFADVLQAHSMEEQPNRIPTLHGRASEWYQQNGLLSDAVRHALAAKDFERAANLIELAWPAMRRHKQEATTLGWVKALPDQLIRARPVLSVVSAWALLNDYKLEAAEAHLKHAERWLNRATDRAVDSTIDSAIDSAVDMPGQLAAPAAEITVVDKAQFESLPASIANARAYRAQALGDVSGTVMYAQQALDLLPKDDYYERGTTAALLGIAYWTSGNLEAAHRSFADGLASLQMGGGLLIRIGGTFILANIRMTQGRLHEAIRTYEQSLQLAAAQSELRGTAELYLGLSELSLERGDLETARQYLQRGKALRKQASLPGYDHFWCIVQARIKEAEADPVGALDLLHEAERLYYRSPLPDVRPISALKVRMWVRQGKLAQALGWVREQGLSVDDDLSYLHEYEHVTLARLLIAQYKRDRVDSIIHQAMGLLDRLLTTAEAGERTGSVIEILIVQAVAHAVQGDIPCALVPLKRALALAEPEGYVQIFVDEGVPMTELLSEAITQGIKSDDIGPNIESDNMGQLLAACGSGAKKNNDNASLSTPHLAQAKIKPLIEPLSQRELEILQLIAEGLSNREIGDRLFLALNTVKGHNRRIFGKLEVQRRTEAVARARELGLL